MAQGGSAAIIFHFVTLAISLLVSVGLVEARRGSRKNREGASHTSGNYPLPWWVITLIFVGGVLGLFLCVAALRKIYEKKRKQKIRAMATRRSMNIQRRRSLQNNVSTDDTTNGVTQGSLVAPPSYEQSAKDDAQPPAYSKDVDTNDEQATSPPPATHDTSVPMDTALSAAPPNYDVAQNDGSEVVEMGGVVGMEMSPADNRNSNTDQANATE